MLSTPVIVGVIVLMMIVVSGDDTQALRDTISSLCSLNKVGQFASCCGSYDNGASITLKDSTARSCFISNLKSTTGSVVTYLFVICFIFVLFLLFDDCHCFSLFIFRNFYKKELFHLGKSVFSSLTNLQSLLSVHFFLHSFSFSGEFDFNNLTSIESGTFNGLNSLRYLSYVPLSLRHLTLNLLLHVFFICLPWL